MQVDMMKGMQSCQGNNGSKKGKPTQGPMPEEANAEERPRSLNHIKAT